MIAALIEYFTDYEYDYKFYAMCELNASFPVYEEIFLFLVFFIDVFILMALVLFGTIFAAFSVAWICGAL